MDNDKADKNLVRKSGEETKKSDEMNKIDNGFLIDSAVNI